MFDWHRNLDHRAAVDLARARDYPRYDAMRQTPRIAEGDDGLPLFQRLGVAQVERLEAGRVHPDHGQVLGAVEGVNGGHLAALAVG